MLKHFIKTAMNTLRNSVISTVIVRKNMFTTFILAVVILWFIELCKGWMKRNNRFLGPYEVCNFCVQVKYLLNFRAYKICIKKIPKTVPKDLVPLDVVLKDNMNMCEVFFLVF